MTATDTPAHSPGTQLAARLEAGMAAQAMALAEATRRTTPDSSARSAAVGRGAYVALGPDRYVNRAIGFGLCEADELDLEHLSEFFAAVDLPPAIELSERGSGSLASALAQAGFRRKDSRDVFVLDGLGVQAGAATTSRAEVLITRVDDSTEDTVEAWQDVLSQGFGALEGEAREISDEFSRAEHDVPGSYDLLAWVNGRAVACGSLQVVDGIGWLGGATTMPQSRRRGCQTALIQARVELAVTLNCSLIAVTATPDSDSSRNLIRHRFRPVFRQHVMVAEGTRIS